MNYQIDNKLSENSLLILGFYESDDNSGAHLYSLEAYLDTPLKPKKALSTLFYHHAQRPVLLVNLGEMKDFNLGKLDKAVKAVCGNLTSLDITSADVYFPTLPEGADETVKQTVMAFEHHLYHFDAMKSKKTTRSLESLQLLMHGDEQSLALGQAISQGVNLARDLGNLPPNVCTPSYLVETAKSLAKSHSKLKAHILDEKQMTKMGMNTLLSVSRGSEESAYLIDLRYENGGDKAPHMLIGKGITFDSGGLSLKPPQGMEEMKFDMCGAASVLGALKTVIELDLPINLNVLVATSENLPGPTATRPGDIVESYSKQTVEILNTDAEGRLVLCDALTYAEQFEPASVVDVATLTGAMIIALGHQTNGLMGNDDALCDALLAAGQKIGDKAWRFPIWDEYQELINSNVADIANVGAGRAAGSITSACFLSRFAEKFKWAHIDCAGTAWVSGKNKCASGRPVPLLAQYLLDQCQ